MQKKKKKKQAKAVTAGAAIPLSLSRMKGRSKPTATFMAFGTKGDVYPIAAIAAAVAGDQRDYQVFFVTHSAHQNLAPHLEAKNVAYIPVSAPPVLSAPDDPEGSEGSSFSLQKKTMTREHRGECLLIMEKIFGDGPSLKGDFVVINFFALEGWSFAELFHIRCVVAAPYVVPYSAPSSFERQFMHQLPLLYEYLQEAQTDEVSWNDVIHWMWPIFTEEWGVWRSDELNLSHCPFTDPVTGLPMWHERCLSPLLMYGFSREVVECPDYWPASAHICGFWFLPQEWQFSCLSCKDIFTSMSTQPQKIQHRLCTRHMGLQAFLETSTSMPLIFIGLSSIGSMGLLGNPQAFLDVLQAALETTKFRFILFTAGYEPLDMAVRVTASENYSSTHQQITDEDGICLFTGRLFCFSGSIPYGWLFQRCAVAVHHGGSGSTAAALHAGIPQVLCPFMFDQFYWAERTFWLGVAPEPLKREHWLPDTSDKERIREGATILSSAITYALSTKVKARAQEISERISSEDGVAEAVRILKEKVCCPVV